MQAEEAGRHEEGERDQERPRITASSRCLAGGETEDDVHERRGEDQPEVARPVLQVGVSRRDGEEDHKADDGEQQRDERDAHARRA